MPPGNVTEITPDERQVLAAWTRRRRAGAMSVTLEALNAASEDDFIAALGDTFEHSPWVAKAASSARPFATLAALHEAMTKAVRAAPADARLKLIRAHPDLAGKAARAGTLTAESTSEQASVGLDRLTDVEFARFHKLNDAYKAEIRHSLHCLRAPSQQGFHPRAIRAAAHAWRADELGSALDEIFRIAALRLDQKVAAPDSSR